MDELYSYYRAPAIALAEPVHKKVNYAQRVTPASRRGTYERERINAFRYLTRVAGESGAVANQSIAYGDEYFMGELCWNLDHRTLVFGK